MNQRSEDARIIALVTDMANLQREIVALRNDVSDLMAIMTKAKGAVWLVRAAAIVVASCAAAWTWVSTNSGFFRLP